MQIEECSEGPGSIPLQGMPVQILTPVAHVALPYAHSAYAILAGVVVLDVCDTDTTDHGTDRYD